MYSNRSLANISLRSFVRPTGRPILVSDVAMVKLKSPTMQVNKLGEYNMIIKFQFLTFLLHKPKLKSVHYVLYLSQYSSKKIKLVPDMKF